MKLLSFIRIFSALVLLALLQACSGVEQEDIQRWMTEQRNATKPTVVPLPEPKRFSPAPYGQLAAVEPFSNQKLTQALKRDSAQGTSNAALVAPELNRRKEPLEAFPFGLNDIGGQSVAQW